MDKETDFLIQALPLLLHDHDCLVIPELGGFVAHPVPARFDADKGEWVPPGRNVAFNPKLTVRDGLLEQEIRRATACTNDAAAALIDQEVLQLKARLDQGGTQEIPGLGRLYMMDSGLIGFAPEPRLGERYAPPGLGRIPWVDLEAQKAPTPETVPENEESTAIHWGPTLSRVAAILLLPLFVAGSLWWGNSSHSQFEFLRFEDPVPATYIPRIEGEDIRFPEMFEEENLSFLDPGAPELAPRPADEALMPLPRPQSLSTGCTLHVIAGTFSSLEKAAGLARRFESLGYATSLLPGPEGQHRVSTGCFNDPNEARQFRKGLQTHHGIDQAWILKF